jgi:predicted nuclease of predicted toxin-antitoxin system
VRFLVDAQLPPALARWLGEQGLSATAVRDVGLHESDDGSILNFAASNAWTILTKDEDLVTRSFVTSDAPAIVWLRLGNCTNRVLFAWLAPFIPEIQRRLQLGEKLIEVRDAPLKR